MAGRKSRAKKLEEVAKGGEVSDGTSSKIESKSMMLVTTKPPHKVEDVSEDEEEERQLVVESKKGQYVSKVFGAGKAFTKYVIVVPWNVVMKDEFQTLRLTDEEKQEYESRRNKYSTTQGNASANRVTDFWRTCICGCKEPVHCSLLEYNRQTSDYLMCSPSCTDPVAAHKKCIKDRLARQGLGRFVYPCNRCHHSVEVKGTFRLGFAELPFTILSSLTFTIRHTVVWPMLFYVAWTFVLYLQAVVDWHQGYIPFPNPLTLRYVMYSADDPNFKWESETLLDKWYAGITFYSLCMFTWWIVLGWVCRKISNNFRTSLWRYDI